MNAMMQIRQKPLPAKTTDPRVLDLTERIEGYYKDTYPKLWLDMPTRADFRDMDQTVPEDDWFTEPMFGLWDEFVAEQKKALLRNTTVLPGLPDWKRSEIIDDAVSLVLAKMSQETN